MREVVAYLVHRAGDLALLADLVLDGTRQQSLHALRHRRPRAGVSTHLDAPRCGCDKPKLSALGPYRLRKERLEPAVDRIQRGPDGRLADVVTHDGGAGEPVGAGAADHRHGDQHGAVTTRGRDVDVVDLEAGLLVEQLLQRP